MRPYWDKPSDGGARWTLIWMAFTLFWIVLIDGDWAEDNFGWAMGLIIASVVPSIFLDGYLAKREQQRWEEISDHAEYVARTMILEHEEEKHPQDETPDS